MRALLAALALVALAVVVHETAPTDQELTAPLPRTAAVGEWGEVRTFAARVEGVRLASEVTDGEWTGTTGGAWVVVDVSAETVLAPTTVGGWLLLGDERYDVSGRADAALNRGRLSPGLAERGVLLVEVPVEALRAHGDDATLRLSTDAAARRDGVLDVPLDLAGLEPEALLEITAPERTER